MSSSLQEDLRTLWCATSLVLATSTLSIFFIETGPLLRTVFAASFPDSRDAVGCGARGRAAASVECVAITLEDYNLGNVSEKWASFADRDAAMLEYNGRVHVSQPRGQA